MNHKDYIEMIVPLNNAVLDLQEKVEGIIKATGLKEKEKAEEETAPPDATE